MTPVRFSLLAALYMSALTASGAGAQETPPADAPATLIADRVLTDPEGQLRAEGAVEVFYAGNRIQANAIVYNETNDRLIVEGPIRLTDSTGEILLLAEQADLDRSLQDGILNSARLVLDQRMQIAANEIQRSQGRFTQLHRSVASSCEICSEREIPLWQIRAERIIHDQLEKQIYFENATFEVAGVPVFYLPRFRAPDPTLERASGFLYPEFRSTNELGFGIETPYFFVIDDQRDLTISPAVTTENSRTLGLRYRQAFRNGNLEFDGYFTRDELESGDRGLATLDAIFSLPYNFVLQLDLETVSDRSYFRDYGFDDQDRLESVVQLSRTQRDNLLRFSGSYFTTLRDDEDNETIPRYVVDGQYNYRFSPSAIGGQAEVELAMLSLTRPSDGDIIGRDTRRVSGIADWRRTWTSSMGFVGTAIGELAVDAYMVDQDSRFESDTIRTTPTLATELRWPLQKRTSGAQHILEPIGQLVWSRVSDDVVPNEDSQTVEFDEVSLFEFNRFSGRDRLESGWRANLGLVWTRFADNGWDSTVTVGRVFREGRGDGFAPGVDPSESASDWLTTIKLETPFGLDLINRAQYGTDFKVDKNAFRLGWNGGSTGLNVTYTWLRQSLLEGREDDTNELRLGGFRTFNANWAGDFEYTYDAENSRSREAELGVIYRNECITVDLSLSRDWASSASLRDTTDFGITISLNGFGSDPNTPRSASRCSL
ncbi:MAG: LPS assembly protein LptD [Pseudomonadota bacterium]